MLASVMFNVIKFLYKMHEMGYVDDAEYCQLMQPLLGFLIFTSFEYSSKGSFPD